MQTFRPINEISRKHSKNGLMQSGRKRCTRRTAAPAGAGIAPGSGADELRGCTSPLCVRTQNPKPWYELPMSGDANITPAPPTGICGQCRSLRKHRSAEQKRGAGGRDRLRASPRTPQTQKHRTAPPRAGDGRRQRRTSPAQRTSPRQSPVRTQTHSFRNTLSPLRFTAPTGSCAGSTEPQGFHK